MLDNHSVDLFMLGCFINIQHLIHPSDRFSIITYPVMLSLTDGIKRLKLNFCWSYH